MPRCGPCHDACLGWHEIRATFLVGQACLESRRGNQGDLSAIPTHDFEVLEALGWTARLHSRVDGTRYGLSTPKRLGDKQRRQRTLYRLDWPLNLTRPRNWWGMVTCPSSFLSLNANMNANMSTNHKTCPFPSLGEKELLNNYGVIPNPSTVVGGWASNGWGNGMRERFLMFHCIRSTLFQSTSRFLRGGPRTHVPSFANLPLSTPNLSRYRSPPGPS